MTESVKKQYKVLLVDDDQFLLNMYSIKFKASGFEVETASGGPDALSKLRNGLLSDVLLLDVVMPAMDGLEFLDHVKKESLIPNSLYIVLTNQGQSTDIERAKALGVHGYIVKASTIPSEVVEEVKTILRKNGRAVE